MSCSSRETSAEFKVSFTWLLELCQIWFHCSLTSDTGLMGATKSISRVGFGFIDSRDQFMIQMGLASSRDATKINSERVVTEDGMWTSLPQSMFIKWVKSPKNVDKVTNGGITF